MQELDTIIFRSGCILALSLYTMDNVFSLMIKGFFMDKLVKSMYMMVFLQKDLAKGVEFYGKLGFTLRAYQEGQWAEFEVDGLVFALCPVETMNEGHTGVVFNVDDVEGIYAKREDLGLTCIGEPIKGGRGMVLTCADPSGNRFDLYQLPDMECCKGQDSTVDNCCKTQETCC